MKNKKTSKKILIAAMISITLFTIASMVVSYMGNAVPDALIYSFYSFWAVEMLQLAGIKKSKVKYNAENTYIISDEETESEEK